MKKLGRAANKGGNNIEFGGRGLKRRRQFGARRGSCYVHRGADQQILKGGEFLEKKNRV